MVIFRKKWNIVYNSEKGRIFYKDGYYIPQIKRLFGWDELSKHDYYMRYVGFYKFKDLSDAKHFLDYEMWKTK